MPGSWAFEGGRTQATALVMAALAAALVLTGLARTTAFELSLPFSSPGGKASAESAYGELPLAFERDAGRSGPAVDFLARTPAGTTLIGAQGATLVLGDRKHTETLGLELANGAAAVRPQSLERLPGEVNYLVGKRSEWKTAIATFERVRYPNVYPGIDLDWRGNQRQLEYDFRLAAGADPSRIALDISGAEALHIAASGDLVIDTGRATVRQQAPIAYQTIAGERQPVDADFALRDHRIGFRLGAYDRSRPLVIDPLVFAYSTYLGGGGNDAGTAIAVDSSGAAYLTGGTDSTDYCAAVECSFEGDSAGRDVFVSKLNPAGSALVYSTYIGGDGADDALAVAIDSSGAAYVSGQTASTDYCVGTGCSFETDQPGIDAFVSKLTPAGDALAYSTYLGGSADDLGADVAVDSANSAYITGYTDSTDYCTTECSIEDDEAGNDVFVTKLNPAGSGLLYSTYLAGNAFDQGNAIAVDSSGAAYVTGGTNSTDFETVGPIEGNAPFTDGFISKLNPAGDARVYSTYLGGDFSDFVYDIAVDPSGAAYVAGETGSTDFNTAGPIEGDSGMEDVFVSKLTPTGSALTYSTYLGGTERDLAASIAIDSAGAAHITGQTESTDFDTTGPIEGDDDQTDVFVSKLSPAGSGLAYSTYLGGNSFDRGRGIALDSAGASYVTGDTFSPDFDTVNQIEGDSPGYDAFVAKLTFDADADGIPDDADACPTQAGPASNGGCPVTPSPPPAAKAARTLTLDASKSKVKKGKKVRLSGTIDSPGGAACEATQTVELQRVKKGTAFNPFKSAVTDATGAFATKVKVKKTYLYRAELGESAACLADTSNTKKVKVKKRKRKKK